MNQHIDFAKMMIEDAAWEGKEITTEHLSLKLSKNILSMIAYHQPVNAHRQMIESLTS